MRQGRPERAGGRGPAHHPHRGPHGGGHRLIAAGAPCPLCTDRKTSTAVLHAAVLPPFTGDEPPLRLTLHGMPALRCQVGHTYFPRRDLALWLLNRLLEEEAVAVPAGEAKGLLFKRYACGACAKPLEPREHGRKSFEVPLAYEGLDPFGAQLSVPLYRCGACGLEQARSRDELRALLPAALVHAFKAAGLKAPG